MTPSFNYALQDNNKEIYNILLVGKDGISQKNSRSDTMIILTVDNKNKNLKLIYKVEKNLMVKADREKIIRALNNIINNAIKYSPENEKIIIKSFKSKASKTVVLEVENTGVTIENKYLNEVFDPFFRVEKSRNRKTGGSGLGLYIVSKILKSHNLYYKIESKRNSVLFTIYF
jgi:two-component system sensor histidine kinase VanS